MTGAPFGVAPWIIVIEVIRRHMQQPEGAAADSTLNLHAPEETVATTSQPTQATRCKGLREEQTERRNFAALERIERRPKDKKKSGYESELHDLFTKYWPVTCSTDPNGEAMPAPSLQQQRFTNPVCKTKLDCEDPSYSEEEKADACRADAASACEKQNMNANNRSSFTGSNTRRKYITTKTSVHQLSWLKHDTLEAVGWTLTARLNLRKRMLSPPPLASLQGSQNGASA